MDDEIPSTQVLLSDLEVLRAALSSAYHQNLSLDLVENYRKLSNRQPQSAMTKALQGALAKIETYIALAIEEEEPTDE